MKKVTVTNSFELRPKDKGGLVQMIPGKTSVKTEEVQTAKTRLTIEGETMTYAKLMEKLLPLAEPLMITMSNCIVTGIPRHVKITEHGVPKYKHIIFGLYIRDGFTPSRLFGKEVIQSMVTNCQFYQIRYHPQNWKWPQSNPDRVNWDRELFNAKVRSKIKTKNGKTTKSTNRKS